MPFWWTCKGNFIAFGHFSYQIGNVFGFWRPFIFSLSHDSSDFLERRSRNVKGDGRRRDRRNAHPFLQLHAAQSIVVCLGEMLLQPRSWNAEFPKFGWSSNNFPYLCRSLKKLALAWRLWYFFCLSLSTQFSRSFLDLSPQNCKTLSLSPAFLHWRRSIFFSCLSCCITLCLLL